MKNLFLIVCLLAAAPLFAQSDTLLRVFNRVYLPDSGKAFNGGAFETQDNFLIVTNTSSTNNAIIELRAIDKETGLLLHKNDIFTAPYAYCYFDKNIYKLSDTSFIATLLVRTMPYNYRNTIMINFNDKGIIQWQREYGSDDWDEVIRSVTKVKSGGYIMTGEKATNEVEDGYAGGIYVVRTDEQGVLLWEQYYDTPDGDIGLIIHESSEGGYMLSGIHSKKYIIPNSEGASIVLNKMLVMKIDSSGNVLWTLYPKDDNKEDSGCVITPIPDTDNYLIRAGGIDYSYLKSYWAAVDENGNLLWEKIIEEDFEASLQGSVYFLPNKKIIGKGFYINASNATEGYLACFDSNYEIEWYKSYTTNASRDHYIRGMLPTSDGGYLLTGLSMEGYAWELKVDSLGNTCWFNAPPQWEEATDTQGNPYYTAGCDSMYIEVLGIEETFAPLGGQGGVSITPNPATDKLFIHSPEALTNVAIYNTLGQQFPLFEGARGSTNSPSERGAGGVNEGQGGAENELSVAHLTSGIYFVQAYTKSGKVMTHKFVKQ